MKKEEKQFEEMLRKAVCSYHKMEQQAWQDEEVLQELPPLSDKFYEGMEKLVRETEHRPRRRFLKGSYARYAAAAAAILVLLSGTVGMAAYVLLGAENFSELFRRNARECRIADDAVMDLEQLKDMAVTATGIVYEDHAIRLEVDGLIKSGNMLSMLLKGTLKEMEQITVAGGPEDPHSYGFLEQSIDLDTEYSSSSVCYYQEEDSRLGPNQFLYLITYTADTEFDRDAYTFTCQDFGYFPSDCMPEETEAELDPQADSASAVSSQCTAEEPVAVCSGVWKFAVNMDQASDISVQREYHIPVDTGHGQTLLESIRLSPLGCCLYLSCPAGMEDIDYFDHVKLLLKDGSYLDDSYYDMTLTESTISEEDTDGKKREAKRIQVELQFEFHVPVDIQMVRAAELFGVTCDVIQKP